MRVPAARRASRALGAPAAIAVAALLAAGALVGCGGASSSAAPAPPRVFIDLVSSLPASLDPADELGPAFDRLETSLAGTLVRPAGRPPAGATLAPAGSVVGFLATSWRELANGDFLFDLRPGVRSTFGHPLTAADVSFSFTRELARSATARFLAGVAKIAARDPITVIAPTRLRLNVTAPSPLVLAILAGFRFAVLDRRAVRAHATPGDPSAHAWLARHLAFYGAYALAGFAPGRRVLLATNPRFGVPAAFARVAIEAVPSPVVRLADVGAATASHTSELDGATFQTAAHTSGIAAQTMPATAVSTLVPNERFTPFASPLVRRALSLAIDRAAIVQAAFAGLGKPATHPEPATYAPVVGVRQPAYGHDVALARAILARAGYARGFSFVLAAPGGQDAGTGAELAALTRELRRIGVTVVARRLGSAPELARLVRAGSLGGVLETWVSPVASASFDIAARYLRHSPGNLEAYDSPALDALGPALTAAPRPGRAADRGALQRALNILGATQPVIPLVEIPAQNVTLAQIGGYAAYPVPATYYDRLHG